MGQRDHAGDAKRREQLLEAVVYTHTRSTIQTAQAKSQLDCRDWAMFEALQHPAIQIRDLAAKTGLTHAALYKAVRRGASFREPPLPF